VDCLQTVDIKGELSVVTSISVYHKRHDIVCITNHYMNLSSYDMLLAKSNHRNVVCEPSHMLVTREIAVALIQLIQCIYRYVTPYSC